MERISIVIILMTVTLLLLFTSEVVKGNCEPCDCLPSSSTPVFMICQGWKVNVYPPNLGEYEKSALREIYLTETLISCLPSIVADDYPNLLKFGESGNQVMNCTCLESWRENVPREGFVSDCDFDSISSATTTNSDIDVITATSSPVTFNTTSDTEEGCCQSSIGDASRAPTPLLPLSTPASMPLAAGRGMHAGREHGLCDGSSVNLST